MKVLNPYCSDCNWLKGNLHTHTRESDGAAERSEVLAIYRDDGYDFLALTDHDTFSPCRRHDGMVLLGAQECHVSEGTGFDCHIVSLGETGRIPRMDSAQAIIDEIRHRRGLAIVCHPRWSFMPYDVFDELKGYAAFEVYNGSCDKEVGRGFSNDYWDRHMSRLGTRRFGLAVDDMHRPTVDFATGWIWANAEKESESILGAIARGDYYSTAGPRIETIRVTDNTIEVYTSSAKAVKFITANARVAHIVSGEHVKRAAYSVTGEERYIRVEVHGHDGKVAWTNPFWIEP